MFQYITSLTQNAAVKPGTIFISRPLVSTTEDDSKPALFTNGTELTVANDAEAVAVAVDDQLEVWYYGSYILSVIYSVVAWWCSG